MKGTPNSITPQARRELLKLLNPIIDRDTKDLPADLYETWRDKLRALRQLIFDCSKEDRG